MTIMVTDSTPHHQPFGSFLHIVRKLRRRQVDCAYRDNTSLIHEQNFA